MDELDVFKATYFEECAELLTELEAQFAAMADGDKSAARLNAAFRAVHSIKGGAGAFGFAELVQFSHAFETLMDQMRAGKVAASDTVLAQCMRATDLLADFVDAARNGAALPADFGARERDQFDRLCGGQAEEDLAEVDDDPFGLDFTPVPVVIASAAEPAQGWRIRFAPHRALYENGNDPLLLLRELGRLGSLEVTAEVMALPPLDGFDPLESYCTWDLVLHGAEIGLGTVREVFEFVEGECLLEIEPLVPDEHAEPEAAGLSFADLAAQLLSEPVAAKPVPEPVALQPEAGRPEASQSIRVDLEKVDRVVNMVGELVITQSMLTQQLDDVLRARYPELVRGLEVLAQTTRGLQDAVMAIRAQPVKAVFSRMPRLVRELAAKTGKSIRLETQGEATEIDKAVLEQLADPLMHMIRNSADHGIEAPEGRLAAGKAETGTIRLSAEQSGGNILVVVEDDGAGINRERVAQIARQRGLVAPDQPLSDDEIDNLIFTPGFSTASQVSDISGRGVGMDVVLANIKRLGGSVAVRSWPGRGTRMTLRLPLTLAVLDVMMVELAGLSYVIPLSSIIETFQSSKAQMSQVPGGGRLVQVRGHYVPLIDLGEAFGLARRAGDVPRFVVLCEGDAGSRLALLVDDILGQQQVVIKSLEQNYERVAGIAGGTILGDGTVALIIDVGDLKTLARRAAA